MAILLYRTVILSVVPLFQMFRCDRSIWIETRWWSVCSISIAAIWRRTVVWTDTTIWIDTWCMSTWIGRTGGISYEYWECTVKLTIHCIDYQWLISDKITLKWFDSGNMHSTQMEKKSLTISGDFIFCFCFSCIQYTKFTCLRLNTNNFKLTNSHSFSSLSVTIPTLRFQLRNLIYSSVRKCNVPVILFDFMFDADVFRLQCIVVVSIKKINDRVLVMLHMGMPCVCLQRWISSNWKIVFFWIFVWSSALNGLPFILICRRCVDSAFIEPPIVIVVWRFLYFGRTDLGKFIYRS